MSSLPPPPTTTIKKEDVLKRYLSSKNNDGSSNASSETKKKKKKRVSGSSSSSSTAASLIIMDETPIVPVRYRPSEELEEEDEKPVIVGEVEDKKLSGRGFSIGISDDGSGWTVVSDNVSKKTVTGNTSNARSSTSVESDLSPVRNKRAGSISPPRRRHDSDEDLSPVRKQRAGSISPPRRRHDSDGDISPVRKSSSVSTDLSPKRKRHDEDLSPIRKRTDTDISPPRRKTDNDLSPVRQKPTMSSGLRSGLLSNEEITEEVKDRKRKMSNKMANIDPVLLGKGADTVYRDKRGKKLSINEIIEKQEGKLQDDDEAGMEWGKGLVQKQQREDRKAREEAEKDKPFARLPDDPELDSHFRGQDRWGDPMAKLVGSTDKKEKKEKKEKKTKKEKKEFKPERRWKVGPPPNRYNILPGYRWDGVDRSNGFEIKLLQRDSVQKAQSEEAYMWSVEDM